MMKVAKNIDQLIQMIDTSDMQVKRLSHSQPDTVRSVYCSNKCTFNNVYSSCDRGIQYTIEY